MNMWHSVAALALWPFLHQGRQIKVVAPQSDFAVSDFKHAYSNVKEKHGSNTARTLTGHPAANKTMNLTLRLIVQRRYPIESAGHG